VLPRLLLALIAMTVLAIAGLVAANLVSRPSEVAYQNDEYTVPAADTNPPPLPEPKSVDEARDLVTNNRFYAQTAPIPVRCAAAPINVAAATDAQLKSHFEALMECLVRVWQPPVQAAGYILPRPTVTIYGSEARTKCGNSGVNASYCGADQQVYFSNQLARRIPIIAEDKWAADVVMAHEFGHALQGRTGIIVSEFLLEDRAANESERLRLSRRAELQADCLSGMFLRAVSRSLQVQQSDVVGIQRTYQALGDRRNPGDHGQAVSRTFWGATGLGTSSVGACNTFTATDSQVQ
jgi:predicted metalloprotease